MCFRLEQGMVRKVFVPQVVEAYLDNPAAHAAAASIERSRRPDGSSKLAGVGVDATVAGSAAGSAAAHPMKAKAAKAPKATILPSNGAHPVASGDLRMAEGSLETLLMFDFDDTVFHPPDEDSGKKALQLLTGEAWTKSGWFHHPESLDPRLGVRIMLAFLSLDCVDSSGAPWPCACRSCRQSACQRFVMLQRQRGR